MRKTQVVAAATAVLLAGGAVVAASGGIGGRDDGAGVNRTQAASAMDTGGDLRDGANAFATDAAGGASAGSGAMAAPAADESRASVAPGKARVVKTAQLDLSMRTNEAVTQATQRANQIAEAHGGFVASTDSNRGKGRQSTLTLRIPVDRYEAALTELRRLGKVTSESLGGRDVTGTLVDLEARLRTLRAQEEALNALVAKARTVGETLEVAREAANVRMQVEQLAAQQAQLADQADFATVTLRVAGPNVAIDPEPKPQPLLVGALERAVGGTLNVFGGAIVLLGYVLPAALLAALGYGVWRLVRSRRPQEPAVAS